MSSVNRTQLKREKTVKKRVRFSETAQLIIVPNRHSYRELFSEIWWSRKDLNLTATEAGIILREVMTDNPCLSMKSAMFYLYQSEEMFNSRVRMLIVNDDNELAKLTRNEITNAHRSNIWEVEICTVKAAFKIVSKNATYYDLILIETSPCIKDFFLIRQLMLGLHRLREEKTLVGILFDDTVDDHLSSSVVANVHTDFIWRSSMSFESHSKEQMNLRKLLALRHLQASDKFFWSKGELRNSLDGSVAFSVYSYPLGYTF